MDEVRQTYVEGDYAAEVVAVAATLVHQGVPPVQHMCHHTQQAEIPEVQQSLLVGRLGVADNALAIINWSPLF